MEPIPRSLKHAHLWLVHTLFLRLASFVWPVRVWKGIGKHGTLELTWEQGRLVVNSSNANQSHGSLHRVWRQAFADEVPEPPQRVLVLGWGAGSIEHILRNELGTDPLITGVDDDEVVVELGRRHFGTALHPHTTILLGNAFDIVGRQAAGYDLILVDLFHDLMVHPKVAAPSFLEELRRLKTPAGQVMVNIVEHDAASRAASTRFGTVARQVFSGVRERRYEGNNRVFIAL